MISAIGTRKDVQVIQRYESQNMVIEVLEYQNLKGVTSPGLATAMYFMDQKHMRARQIAVYMNNTSVTMQPGAMSYIQGNIEMVSGVTVGNIIGKAFKSAVTGENVAQPEYKGTGVVVLEPSFKHFLVLELSPGEEIVVDKKMFYVAQGSVQLKPFMQKTLSSAALGQEGLFQISLTGPGLVVLECKVPMEEINQIHLDNDVLKVDGNFAVLRSAGIQFTVERSAKTLVCSAVAGEGLVNVYRGTGDVWLAPTLKIYQALQTGNLNMNTGNTRVSST